MSGGLVAFDFLFLTCPHPPAVDILDGWWLLSKDSKEVRQLAMRISGEEHLQAEGTSSVKALRQDHIRNIHKTQEASWENEEE